MSELHDRFLPRFKRLAAYSARNSLSMPLGALVATLALAGQPTAADPRDEDISKLDACLAAAVPWKEADACLGIIDAPCQAAGRYSTQEMVECLARERRAWQSILDTALARLHAEARETDSQWLDAGTGPALDAALTASQESWDTFQEAQCHYWRQRNFGGSIARLNSAACYMQMTAERAIALDRLARPRD